MAETTTPPSWLNADFCLYVLNNIHDKSNFEIVGFEIAPALSEGENFASEVFRTKINYKENGNDSVKTKTFFVKRPIGDGALAEMVKEVNVIEKEMKMYYEYFPMVERLVGKFDFIPKYFPSNDKSTLVLEDLSEEGYIMCDKLKQLDFEHSAAVLKSLAYFHASSVVLHKRNTTFVETLGEPMLLKTDSAMFTVYFKERCAKLQRAVENWKGFERFGDMCCQYNATCLKDARKIFARRKTLNVMNHGDTWTNNIMFKYGKDGNIENVKLVDFQISIYGSIGIDLQYFTWTSIQPSLREHRLPELYNLYLETLNSCLEKFGCDDRLNLEQFEEEMDFSLFYVYFTVVISHYVMLIGTYKDKDVAEDLREKLVYDDKWFRTGVQQALLYLESRGIFGKTGVCAT